MWKLARFYYPTLRLQLALYPIVGLLLVAADLLCTLFIGSSITMTVLIIASFLEVLAPVAFTRHDCRFISSMLPVTAHEKLGFLLIYCWIVASVVLMGPMILAYSLLGMVDNAAVQTMVAAFLSLDTLYEGMNVSPSLTFCFVAGLSIQTIVLYPVVTKKRNRTLLMVMLLVGTFLVEGFFGLFAGGIYGFYMGYTEASGGTVETDPEAWTRSLAELTLNVEMFTALVLLIVAVILLIKMSKKLRNCGF